MGIYGIGNKPELLLGMQSHAASSHDRQRTAKSGHWTRGRQASNVLESLESQTTLTLTAFD